MQRLRRNLVAGGIYFFTVVTHQRRPILTTELGRKCLHESIGLQLKRQPFDLLAIVLLPDHLHTMWQLPPGDDDYSTRWKQIKEQFTRKYCDRGGKEGDLSTNRLQHRERGIWQHRFWEHTIEDDDDFKHCLDYIHWNPVKHGFVKMPSEYKLSSFLKWVKLGEYDRGWGLGEVVDVPGSEWE